MIEADLILRGGRLLTLEPLKDERPRVGPAAGDVGAVNDGFVAARDGMIVATGHGRAHERFTRAEGALDKDVGGRVVMPVFATPPLVLPAGFAPLVETRVHPETVPGVAAVRRY